MNLPRLLSLLSIGLLLSSTLSHAGDAQTVTVTVPKGDKIAIRIPAAWQQTVIQPTPELPPTVKITTATNTVSLQITFIPDTEGRFATKDSVDRVATEGNQQYVAGSVEKRLSLTQLVSNSVRGCYATFTDADLAGVTAPKNGQFRNVASGVFVIKKQIAPFTLLSNDKTSDEYRQALQIVTEGISTQ